MPCAGPSDVPHERDHDSSSCCTKAGYPAFLFLIAYNKYVAQVEFSLRMLRRFDGRARCHQHC